ncbi:hypothetical protein FALCPG4_006894 [Fusarium falciforme]
MPLAKWQSGENDDDSTRLTPTSEHRVPLLAAHDLLEQLPPPACSSLWKSELSSLGQAAHSQQRNPHSQTVGDHVLPPAGSENLTNINCRGRLLSPSSRVLSTPLDHSSSLKFTQ